MTGKRIATASLRTGFAMTRKGRRMSCLPSTSVGTGLPDGPLAGSVVMRTLRAVDNRPYEVYCTAFSSGRRPLHAMK